MTETEVKIVPFTPEMIEIAAGNLREGRQQELEDLALTFLSQKAGESLGLAIVQDAEDPTNGKVGFVMAERRRGRDKILVVQIRDGREFQVNTRRRLNPNQRGSYHVYTNRDGRYRFVIGTPESLKLRELLGKEDNGHG